MRNETFIDRLNNPGVVRVYAHMIRTSPVDTVKELYDNIKSNAGQHPKFLELEKLYKERIG